MPEVMTRIELGGVLGKTYGNVHHRLIRTTAEAINSLTKTINGLEKFLNTSKMRGLTYAVFKGKKNIGVDDLGFPVSGEVIRIVPVVIGSKKAGVLQTILGAVLVVVGVVIGYFSGGTLSAVGYGAANLAQQ
ncbi:Phage-related protein, tail component [Citrobacter koseri]|nr:Phage-related protein, tail component [Citrobacter koseri]